MACENTNQQNLKYDFQQEKYENTLGIMSAAKASVKVWYGGVNGFGMSY